MSEDLEELDKLARDFIIGYVPLTPEQKEILAKIKRLETECNVLEARKKRIERVLNILHIQLAEGRKQ
ncbi:MAG: hypothetical protein ACYTFW_16960 [Planctomycetota bacterium]|jgi:hypothetical protein